MSNDDANGNGDRLEIALAAVRALIDDRQAQRLDAYAHLHKIDEELKRLRTAERALDPHGKAKPVKKVSTADAVHAIMGELKTATQAEVADRLGKPKNTAKHALETLVKRGLIQPTGNMVNRSPEFALADS